MPVPFFNALLEKLLPAGILPFGELHVEGGIAGRFGRILTQRHPRFLRSPSPFANVALEAGAHDIFPRHLSATTAGNDVVERQMRLSESLSAILTFVFVAQENVPAVELHDVTRHAVVVDQTNDPWNLHLKTDGLNPLVVGVRLFKFQFQHALFDPLAEIVSLEDVVFDGHHLSRPLTQQAE